MSASYHEILSLINEPQLAYDERFLNFSKNRPIKTWGPLQANSRLLGGHLEADGLYELIYTEHVSIHILK
jgi:hypothetical protein